jgi:hypothetical protein
MQYIDALHIVPAGECDSEALYDFIGEGWKDRSSIDLGESSRQGRVAHSTYDWAASQVGKLNGKLVTHVGVWELQMRVGCAFVRTGGVNLVCTHPEQRGKGLMRKTFDATLHALGTCGYDMSILLGSTMYAKFGYVPAWPATEYVVKTARLPSVAPDVQAQPFNPYVLGNREAVAPFYNRDHRGITGTVQRPTLRLGQAPNVPGDEGWFLVDAAGNQVGYVLGCPNPARSVYFISHAGGDSEQVLRVVAHLARQHTCEQVRFARLPYKSPLCRRLRKTLPALTSQPEPRDDNWWIQLINLRTTLERIAPELELRLEKSHLYDWSGEILIKTSEEQAVLSITRGHITVSEPIQTEHIIEGGQEIAQLVLGCEDPSETIEEAGTNMNGDAKELMEVLFPSQRPMMGDEAF